MTWLKQLAFSEKKYIACFIFFSLLIAGAIIGQAYSIVKIVDSVFIDKSSFEAILPYAALLAGAICVRLAAQASMQLTANRYAGNVKTKVRQQLMAHWSTPTSKPAGEKIAILQHTVQELHAYYAQYIPQFIKTLTLPAVIVITLFFVHPTSAIIMLITAPFIPLTYILIGIQTKAKSEQQLTKMNRFSSTFLEMLYGLQTLKLFGKAHEQEHKLNEHNRQFSIATLSVLKIAFASTLFIELITTLGIGLVALEIGFRMIVFQTLAFAPAFFVLTVAPEYYQSLKELGAAFHTGRGSLAAAEILQEALYEPKREPIWGTEAFSEAPSLTLKDASIQYEQQTIGPITLTVPSKQTIAIIGPSGHGKTTILHMLAGLIKPDTGQLLIDSKAQSRIEEQKWRQEMMLVAQRPYLFAATLRENLQMGKDYSEEHLLEALQQVQLIAWFKQLANGLDTKIGEGGLGLSGGEQQRIALARAWLKKPSVLLLDEPTAALDVKTAEAVHQLIQQFHHHSTVVIVAHRYESIAHADIIYEVRNGQLKRGETSCGK
ncbi:thiol reductant ABC exporter subunit CydD [Metasolibacillus meyeri]|uniref:thiol reductant ABC exporter subunit CydD n=1 Tax=Metasolibacillus meyeri TaxID=1071052 RepID=UPI000D3063FE|nr:thiol reductant ABC exporter subunit CydD [Metasolibacillus meyeri]